MPPKKGKKGKKGSKSGKKKKNDDKEESATKMAIRNSNIWEARLGMMEHAREHFRNAAKELMGENEELRDHMRQTEKDTIDVVSFLKKQDLEKDTETSKLQQEIKNMRVLHQKDKDEIIDDFNKKIKEYEEKLTKRTEDLSLLKNELNQVKEFRKKKVQMQKELEEIKEAMVWNEKEHKEQISRNEQKFFEEKMRLQQEANKKIEELAQKAHDEAIKNLDEATRNIYKENVKLAESLKLNLDENANYKKVNALLYEDNANLKGELQIHKKIVEEKVDLTTKQTKKIKDMTSKIDVLEKSLAQVIKEFEIERKRIIERSKIENESSIVELEKLRKTVELKTAEMNKVKKLAKTILNERSEMEKFFLDSLDYVREQIVSNRTEYRKEANSMFNGRMMQAHKGLAEYPKIRTFSKKFDAASTNHVFRDLEEAEKWDDISSSIEISDLTWEQKERVLRELFARMNRQPKKTNRSQLAISQGANDSDDNRNSDSFENKFNATANENYTFLTQPSSHVENMINVSQVPNTELPSNKLPAIF